MGQGRLSAGYRRPRPTSDGTMIENDNQYRMTQEQVVRLKAGLARMIASQPTVKGIDPMLLEMVKADVRGLLAKLYDEIADYEAKHGRPATDERGDGNAEDLKTPQGERLSGGAHGS